MFKIVPWSEDLDLRDFYANAASRGFENNASEHMLVKCFDKEEFKQTWILYHGDTAVGSVAAHSLDIMGDQSFRICARTCVFSDMLPMTSLRTLDGIIKHQNYTAQYLMTTCIEWAGKLNDLYITSNESSSGSQRLVHKIFCPALAVTGVLEPAGEREYRGLQQSFWKVNVARFYEDLDRYGRWSLDPGS